MEVIVITNRKLCSGNFFERIELLAESHPSRLILREKDLSEQDYEELAIECQNICFRHNVNFSVHNFIDVACRLKAQDIHLPMPILREHTDVIQRFRTVGVSVHSVEEAIYAEQRGVSYIIAGHIFATDCKKGVMPRGTDFLTEVCKAVSIPVYAIGGITPEKVEIVENCGASGICVMSGMMYGDGYKKFIF